MYSRTRDLPDKHHTKGRKFLEQLWQECGRFLDANAPHHAMVDMPPVFWELYLAHALRRSGINVVEQNRRKKSQRGPDLCAVDTEVWIEAVVANPGTGGDALQAPPRGVTYSIPVESFVLRLRSVIEAKSRIIKGYIEDRIIQQDQAAVIAISGCMLYTQFSEQPVPRIVRAALGVGNLIVDIGRKTENTVCDSVEESIQIKKSTGALVRTDVFLNAEYAHISALIYSA
jgi:hypothetical protein